MAVVQPDRASEDLATNQYFDRNFDLPAVKLLPGEYYVTKRDVVLVTVLGSCVSACIRDPLTGAGGMNHFMLPEAGAADPDNPTSSSARYGTFAMEILINELIKLGAARSRLEAKVFGGGNVLKGLGHANVGERNSSFVLAFMAFEKITVSAKDLLDDFPRKVYFFPRTGRVLVKKLRTLHNDTVLTRERDYGRRLRAKRLAGHIELFS